jgi:hypothetical protein
MKPFRWSHENNERLKVERNISFEEIVLAIEADGLLDVVAHSTPSKYPLNECLLSRLSSMPTCFRLLKKLTTISSKRSFRIGRQPVTT